MTEHGDQIPLDEELEKAKAKLQKLYLKVRSYSEKRDPGISQVETRPLSSSAETPEDVPLEEIRNKLTSINDYFRNRLAGLKANPPVFNEPKLEPQLEPEPEPPPPAVKIPELKEIKPSPSKRPKVQEVEAPSEKAMPEVPFVYPEPGGVRTKVGVGLDLGTSSIIASRENDENRVVSKIERNVFLSVRNDETTKNLLAKLNIKYAAAGGKLYVLGDMALELSHIFNREGQRPMRIGILNPGEMESLPIIRLLVQHVLWEPRAEGEICCFSMPAKILDSESDTIYHQGVFERILADFGYLPAVVDEGYAVVLSELADKEFTGIGISCGAGLVNVCAAFKSMPVISFAISRGGDWIDKNAATALGVVSSNVMAVKEQGINLKKPTTREEEAIGIYYRSYIHFFLENIARVFSSSKDAPKFTEPVDVVFAGGSCLANGFVEIVKEVLTLVDLGIPVGRIRRAEEPLLSVSRGCLFHAINLAQSRAAAGSQKNRKG